MEDEEAAEGDADDEDNHLEEFRGRTATRARPKSAYFPRKKLDSGDGATRKERTVQSDEEDGEAEEEEKRKIKTRKRRKERRRKTKRWLLDGAI